MIWMIMMCNSGQSALSLCSIHQSLFQVGNGSLSLSSDRIFSTSLLTGVGVWGRPGGGWNTSACPSLTSGFRRLVFIGNVDLKNQTRSWLKKRSVSPETDYKYFHMSNKWTIGWSLLIKALLNQVQMVTMNSSSMVSCNRRKCFSQKCTVLPFLRQTPDKE